MDLRAVSFEVEIRCSLLIRGILSATNGTAPNFCIALNCTTIFIREREDKVLTPVLPSKSQHNVQKAVRVMGGSTLYCNLSRGRQDCCTTPSCERFVGVLPRDMGITVGFQPIEELSID